jgi:hypothetical protein
MAMDPQSMVGYPLLGLLRFRLIPIAASLTSRNKAAGFFGTPRILAICSRLGHLWSYSIFVLLDRDERPHWTQRKEEAMTRNYEPSSAKIRLLRGVLGPSGRGQVRKPHPAA